MKREKLPGITTSTNADLVLYKGLDAVLAALCHHKSSFGVWLLIQIHTHFLSALVTIGVVGSKSKTEHANIKIGVGAVITL